VSFPAISRRSWAAALEGLKIISTILEQPVFVEILTDLGLQAPVQLCAPTLGKALQAA